MMRLPRGSRINPRLDQQCQREVELRPAGSVVEEVESQACRTNDERSRSAARGKLHYYLRRSLARAGCPHAVPPSMHEQVVAALTTIMPMAAGSVYFCASRGGGAIACPQPRSQHTVCCRRRSLIVDVEESWRRASCGGVSGLRRWLIRKLYSIPTPSTTQL